MATNKNVKVPPMEPLGISPRRAAEQVDVSLATIFEWIKLGLVDSTLVNGRRIVNYQSLKKLAAGDKVRKVRAGIWNPGKKKGAA